MVSKKARDMLIVMVLAGKGKWDSDERIEEEARMLKQIKMVDEYLKDAREQ